jgi:adenine-specific DNA-methyltransferase
LIKNSFDLRIDDIYKDPSWLINYQISPRVNIILKKIERNTSQLSRVARVSFGVKFYQKGKGLPPQTEEIVKSHAFTHDIKINKNCKLILGGRDIDRFVLKPIDKYVEYGEWLAEPRNPDLFSGKRVLLRRIVGRDRLIATLVEGDYCNNSLLHTVKSKTDDISPEFLLAVLNSKLIGFYFINKYARDEKTFPEIRVHELQSLPIKLGDKDSQKILASVINKILAITKDDDYLENPAKQAKVREYEKKIDQLVYKLYGLTVEEIEIIENNR